MDSGSRLLTIPLNNSMVHLKARHHIPASNPTQGSKDSNGNSHHHSMPQRQRSLPHNPSQSASPKKHHRDMILSRSSKQWL
jgi:hypothetical protein